MPIVRLFILFVSMTLLSACGDPLQAQIDTRILQVDAQLTQLQKALEQDQVRNATLIKEYAKSIQKQQPEYAVIIKELARDGGTSGPMFTSLQDRFSFAKSQPNGFVDSTERFNELDNLYQATQTTLYNDALSDPLNVLADMSAGTLPRVNAISREASLAANGAADLGVGSQLIGNPGYGQWQTGSNGMSFWEWYGMYALFSNIGDMFSGRRHSYNDWSRGRNYSYYHDYGRTRYSSPKQLKRQFKTEQTAKKNWKGGNFTSAYHKTRTGGSRMSSASKTSQVASKRFNSNFAKGGSKSSFSNNSSFRSNKGGSSRGGFGGK